MLRVKKTENVAMFYASQNFSSPLAGEDEGEGDGLIMTKIYDIAFLGHYTKDTIVSAEGTRVVDGGRL